MATIEPGSANWYRERMKDIHAKRARLAFDPASINPVCASKFIELAKQEIETCEKWIEAMRLRKAG